MRRLGGYGLILSGDAVRSKSALKKVCEGRSVIGVSVSSINWHGASSNHVVDAFTRLRYLVVLKFAQRTFVVSIKNVEASCEDEAVVVATKRAAIAYGKSQTPIGNLMEYEVHEDTPEQRAKLRLGVDEEMELLKVTLKAIRTKWKNAA